MHTNKFFKSEAGQIYQAIGKLTINPRSFLTTVPRVEQDLIPSIVSDPRKSKPITQLLKKAPGARDFPAMSSRCERILKKMSLP